MSCITEHPGFEAVGLNVGGPSVSYQCRQHCGTAPPTALHEYVKTCCEYMLHVSYFSPPSSILLQEVQIYSLWSINQVVLGCCWGWFGKDI